MKFSANILLLFRDQSCIVKGRVLGFYNNFPSTPAIKQCYWMEPRIQVLTLKLGEVVKMMTSGVVKLSSRQQHDNEY